MIIDKRPIKFNYSTNRQAIKYIVVHDTGNPNAGADALAHYRYFNSGNRKASAHYFWMIRVLLKLLRMLGLLGTAAMAGEGLVFIM